jgi:protein tyrosine/serine phosphatase
MRLKNKNPRASKIRHWALLVTGVLFVAALIINAGVYYWINFHGRLSTVTAGKVYRSGEMPLKNLLNNIRQNKIRTVIDLRKTKYQPYIDSEHLFLSRFKIKYFHVPSSQIPAEETIDQFIKIMDEPNNFPVLIHCNDGVGRAVLFSAIYRIEYEAWDSDRARRASRLITYGSSFSANSRKGIFLQKYVPRRREMMNRSYSKSKP